MTIRVAINGFGRIGRNILRALYEGEHRNNIQVVAINDLGAAQMNAHLFQYDSVHGPFHGEISNDAESIYVNDDKIAMFAERDPSKLPWKSLNIDVVYEAVGASRVAFEFMKHLGTNGIFIFTGVPGRKAPVEVDTDLIMRNLVLKNQVVFGTVNAGRETFEAAVRDVGIFMQRWRHALRPRGARLRHAALGDIGRRRTQHAAAFGDLADAQGRVLGLS